MLRNLIRYMLGGLAALTLMSGVVVGATMVAQAVDRHEIEQQVDLSHQEAGFWRVVAGVESGVAPNVGNLLGRELREIVGDSDAINEFRGSSNRYGGITDAIGYDPFDETGLDCFECGPLDERTKQNLRLIEDGQLDTVLGTVVVEPPVEGFDVVPGDLGLVPGVVVWYLAASTLAFGIIVVAHRVRITTIRHEGPTPSEMWVLLVLAPIPVGALWVRALLRERSLDRQVRDAFPDHMRMLDQTDRILDRYSDEPDAVLARQRRDEVYAELVAQTRAGNDGSSEINSLTADLGETMEYLRLRAEARKELG